MSRFPSLYLIAALAAAPALAQQAPPAPTSGPDIVVTGVSLKDAQEALKACLDQHCPPDKDVTATLAVVETQFVAGDYKAARATMLQSLGRNHRFAKQYPVPVSDLLRANSRVAAHLGETAGYRSGALDVVSALKAGLPDGDPRVLSAQLELGDALAKTGDVMEAVTLYRSVARHAHALGLPRNEGFALLRVARLFAVLYDHQDTDYYQQARDATQALIASRDPGLAPFVQAAKLLQANMAVKRGDAGAVDRLIAEYRTAGAGATVPVLLYAPKIEQAQLSGRETRGGDTLNQMAMEEFDNQWIDISFSIAADGKVTDATVLRKSDKLRGDWAKPILTAVAARRYAPLADSTGFLRVERYSFTSAWTTVAGTHIRQRSPIPRIEMVDLSRDPATSGS